jgi:predicted Zn-dependent protease
MKNCRILTVLLLLTMTTLLRAEDYTHTPSGLKFTLPKGWKCTEEKGRLTITNKDKTLFCVGDVIPKEAAKAIFDDIEKFIDQLEGWDEVEVTDGPEKEKVNGLLQTWYEGTAKFNSGKGNAEETEWDMTIITGGKAVLFLIGTGKLGENEKAYEKFFESIKKAE